MYVLVSLHLFFKSCDRDNSKMNRLACMRLARRCAEIVLCVRQEVKEAGDVIRSELFMPLSRLVESVIFFSVQTIKFDLSILVPSSKSTCFSRNNFIILS